MSKSTVTGFVSDVSRRYNTASGNPRWYILLDDPKVYQTLPDGQVGHAVGPSLIGRHVHLDITDGWVVAIREVDPWEDIPEPNRGSVVLLHSDTGTVAQRFNSDGLWRKAGSTGRFSWGDLKVQSPYYMKVLLSTPDHGATK